MTRIVQLCACTLVLLFCAGVYAQEVPGPAPSAATVYFYRYKQSYGHLLRPSVYCDGTRLLRMENGKFASFQVAPGDHIFFAEDKQAGAVITLEAGKTYYFRTEMSVGFWKGHFRLMMMMPEQGKYDLSKLKPTDAKDLERNSSGVAYAR